MSSFRLARDTNNSIVSVLTDLIPGCAFLCFCLTSPSFLWSDPQKCMIHISLWCLFCTIFAHYDDQIIIIICNKYNAKIFPPIILDLTNYLIQTLLHFSLSNKKRARAHVYGPTDNSPISGNHSVAKGKTSPPRRKYLRHKLKEVLVPYILHKLIPICHRNESTMPSS